MSLREECDAAEVVWGRLLDRQDTLRLLAATAAPNVRGHLEDYEPPSARLADILAGKGMPAAGESREAQVLRFIAETGE